MAIIYWTEPDGRMAGRCVGSEKIEGPDGLRFVKAHPVAGDFWICTRCRWEIHDVSRPPVCANCDQT